jgi:hypothetical protein
MTASANRARTRPDLSSHVNRRDEPNTKHPIPETFALTAEEIRQIVLEVLG